MKNRVFDENLVENSAEDEAQKLIEEIKILKDKEAVAENIHESL